MLLPLVLATTLLRLRPDAPALAPDQASAMPVAALGDALLAPGHAPAVAKRIERDEYAPSPPGLPVRTVISLDLAAAPSGIAHFCRRSIAVVRLKPAIKREDDTLPPATPDTLLVRTAYRWTRATPSVATCGALGARFFVPGDGQEQIAIATVRRFVQLQEAARSQRHLPFELTMNDDKGRELAAIYRENPEMADGEKQEILTDVRKALAMLPADGIWYAGASSKTSPDALLPADLVGPHGRRLEGRSVQVLDDWTVAMVLDGHHVVRVRLLRQIPAPF